MNQTGNIEDKRSFPRIPENVKIEIKEITFPMPKEPSAQGRLKNLAEGGIGFTVPTAYEAGTLLGLKIYLAGWQRYKKSYTKVIDDSVAVGPLSAIAQVVWCSKISGAYEVGVMFKDIYEDDYQAMQKYLTKIA